MNNKKLLIYSLLALMSAFSACKRPPQKSQGADSDSTATSTTATRDSSALLAIAKESEEAKFSVADIDFRYIKAKSKISFKSKEQNIDNANIDIRMRKDSVVWISVSKLGFEAARIMVRQDSMIVMDKILGEYSVSGYNELSQKFNFKLSFGLIQSILVGNMPIPKKSNQKFKKEKDYFMLRQEEGKVLIDSYVGEKNRRLKKLMATDQPSKTSLTLDYDDFTELNNYVFPYTSLIQVDYQSEQDKQFYQTVFKIKHQKIELVEQPITFPFVIPGKYKRKWALNGWF